jgi:iron(III) transport system substrate-binding protein
MMGWGQHFISVLALTVLVACAPATPSPPPAQAQPAAPQTARAEWEQEWDKLVAAARQEGKLVIGASRSALWRDALITFEQDFPGITMEYSGHAPTDFVARIYSEREAGQYLWDVGHGGLVTWFTPRDRGVLAPVRDALVLPEVLDETKWFGGFDTLYMDKEKKYLPGHFAEVNYGLLVNRDVVPERAFNSIMELRDPRWIDQISLGDPAAGAAAAHGATWYHRYGEEFVRELLTRPDIVMTRDSRQQVEWLVRGRYPIAIGLSSSQLAAFQAQGLGLNVQPVLEAPTMSPSSGGAWFFTNAPHPNAARVFLNWLLTRRVQERMSQILATNSSRLDVPVVNPEVWPDANRLHEYTLVQKEEFMTIHQNYLALARRLRN